MNLNRPDISDAFLLLLSNFLSFLIARITLSVSKQLLMAAGLCIFLVTGNVKAQTDFGPGEIMFTGYKSDDPDGFSIVLLKDAVTGTVIFITDRGWSNAGGFRNVTFGEGTISFTLDDDYPCGTTFIFTDIGGANDWRATDIYGVIVGTVAIQGGGDVDGMELGTNGDQLFIYQTPAPTSGDQSSFVCMIQMDNNLVGTVDLDEESELPTGLTANDIVRFNSEYDNAKYDCSPNTDDAADLQTAISNDNGSGGLVLDVSNNWEESNNPISMTPGCAFCCGNSVPPTPVISGPNQVQTNLTFTITISGSLAPGEVWELYTAGCGEGTPVQTTTGNSFMITAPGTQQTITYYVRSSEELDCPGFCDELTVCFVANLYAACTTCNADPTICGNCFLPDPTPNPNLDSGCYAIRVIFILDESGSIGGNAEDVEDGVLAFLNALNGQDAEVALIEFSTEARLVNNYAIVNNTYITNIDGYFNNVAYNGQTYFPSGGTNWHGAMIAADALASADLVMFFTDGEPTVWQNGTAEPDCGSGASTQTPEIVNPVKIANKLKSEGTHMFMLGVGGGVVELNLQRMSGFVEYENGVNTLATSDYSIGNFEDLADDLAAFINELCRTTIIMTKEVLGPICDGLVQFRFRVINTGNESAATGVILTDTFPNGYTNIVYNGPMIKFCIGAACDPPLPPNAFQWVPFSVPPNDTVELILTVSVLPTGNYTNIGWVVADNADSANDTFPGNLLVEDMPPTITCPANITIECSDSTIPPATGTPTANDPDGPTPTLTYSDVTLDGSCPIVYTITRTWTATDGCSNSASCTQTIVLVDTSPPILTCPPDVTVTCQSNTSPSALGTATAVDCDPAPSVSHADITVEGICALEFTIYRTWTAEDECGNSGTCLQTIVIDDSTPPTIICPTDATINCSESTLPTKLPQSTNNCGDSVFVFTYEDEYIVQSGSPPCSIQRTWTVSDDCGNTNSCIQTIVVVDNVAPNIMCPANVTISCTSNTLPGQTGTATSTDNCDASPEVIFSDMTAGGSCPQEYVITRIWTALDECGNSATCTQTITVDDNISPALSCPPNITVDCNANTLPANTGDATASDNCDTEPSVTYADVTVGGSCPAEFTITRTWTSSDDCGNSSTCVQTIFVDDSTAPIVSCPPNITIQCTDSTLPAQTGSATSTDNCDLSPEVSHADVTIGGGCPAEYTIQRTWTSEDACGNMSSCIQTITVDDSTVPEISCPPDITIDCADNTLPAGTGTATSTDNCDLSPAVTFNDNIVPGSCPNAFTIQRTWTSTDDCGNSTTCLQIIIVDDNVHPDITCPDDVTIECTDSTLPANTGNASAIDNCDIAPDIEFTDDIEPGSCPQSFIITRTWTTTDLCGNSQTCIQLITIEDTVGPSLTCPADITIECTANTLPANTGSATAVDNCDLAPVVNFTDVTLASETCIYEYTITRTWTAADACENMSTCVQIITIDDSTSPLISCPANVTIACTANTLPAATGEATSTDNCDPAPVVNFTDITMASEICPQEYTISRTWTAEDACGNTSTCLQVITIDDNVAPVVTCPEDVTIECSDNTLPAETGTPVFSDNCDTSPDMDHQDVTFSGPAPNGYTIERTWIITDACGNSATCLQTITLENPIDLEISGFSTDTICSGESVSFETTNQNLGNETYTWTFGSGSSPPTANGIGPHTVTYTYNTTNGNEGAFVELTISLPGCASVTDTVGNVHVNAIPDPSINGSTNNLCYFRLRTFKPSAAEMPGYTYDWDFGVGASIPPISGYGPHQVEYSSVGTKTVRLIVFSNEAGASCGDTATITFNVIACPGNITGRVRLPDGTGIPAVNIRLYTDNNLDGLPDGAPIRSVFTTNTGAYSLVNLAPAQYVVQEIDLAGYFSLSDGDESEDFDTLVYSDPNDNLIPVTIEAQEVDAGNVFVDVISPGIITGYVFEDFDNDGHPDQGEGIDGVTIDLYTDTDQDGVADSGGLVNSTVTSNIGFYSLEAELGDYVLVEIQPAGYNSQQDVDPSNDNDVVPNTNQTDDIIPVTLINGETDAHNYFIEITACPQVITNTNDNGPGSARYVIDCTPENGTITFHSSLAGAVIHLNTDRIIIDKNINIHSDLNPRVMIQSDMEGGFMITAGSIVEIKNLNFTSGFSGYPGAAFENYGELTLWDVEIFRNINLPPGNYLIFNGIPGILSTKGMMRIQFE